MRLRWPAFLPVGVCFDDAGIHSECFPADRALGDTARQHRFEHFAQEVTLTETPMAVLRKGGMIRHRIGQAELAEPAVSEVQVHLFAQPSLGTDAETVARKKHPDHQFRINRRPAHARIVGPQLNPDMDE